jgi:hypothetical protein
MSTSGRGSRRKQSDLISKIAREADQ